MKITLLIVVLFTNLLWAQWGKITIDDALSHAYELDVADINDDGHLDIIASGNAANVVRWYEAPTWTKHNIDVNLYSAGDVLAYDIDGDDTLDVLAGSEPVWMT